MKTVTHFPSIVIERFKPDGLFGQQLRDVDPFPAPLDLPIVAHLSHRDLRAVLDGWQFNGIGSWRSAIHTARSFSSQRLMGALLGWTIGLWRDGFFKRSMPALMATILRRLTWTNSLGSDPQPDPPLRQLIPPTASEANGTPLSVRIA